MQINEFQNDDEALKRNIRIVVITIFIVLVFSVYILKLFSLQVIESSRYMNRSERISKMETVIPAQRGEIYEREAAIPLASNLDMFAVNVVPGEIPSELYDTVLTRLAGYLGIPRRTVDSKIKGRSSFSSFEIKTNVPFDVISNIAENITELPGVSWTNKPMRTYSETGSISHILGYVGNITEDEYKRMYNEGYKKNSVIGKAGIERQYDNYLQGVEGKEVRTKDARGRILDTAPEITFPQAGKKLVLTIDERIQKLAEKTLGERVGAVVVLRPSNGEVLAMVSYPYYDANIFSTDEYAAEYDRLARSPNSPMLNRTVNATYPPASTFKTVMSTAMLNERAFPAERFIRCSGKIEVGDHVYHCHNLGGHGFLDLKNGLAQSCDVYFWVVGLEHLGVNKIAYYAREFGFGQSLEIDLPSQSSGFVPTPEWKQRRWRQGWYDGDTINISIGQGDTLVTPMHIADMMAMVCNSGVIYKPHLLKEVRNPVTDEVELSVDREVLHESTVEKNVWRQIQNDLRYTITNGSAIIPMTNRYIQIAGKTGTAELDKYKNSNDKRHWHSWMVAYAPFNAPVEEQVVVATIVEAVNEWEWWAPYATNIIIQGIFKNQTYEESIKTLGFEYVPKNRGRAE